MHLLQAFQEGSIEQEPCRGYEARIYKFFIQFKLILKLKPEKVRL